MSTYSQDDRPGRNREMYVGAASGGCLMFVLTLGLWPLLMRSPKR